MIFLDTHVAVWLAGGQINRLSNAARSAIDNADSISISPLVALEIQYLVEIGRLTRPADFIATVLSTAGISIHGGSIAEIGAKAQGFDWTRDPFDRLIVAHAITQKASLVTRDESILDNYSAAVW